MTTNNITANDWIVCGTTLRNELREIREALDGEDRINRITRALADRSYLQVENIPASDGGILLGAFRFCRTSDPAGYEHLTAWKTL